MTARPAVTLLAACVVAALALSACGGGDAPPDMAYGRDVSAETHMIISEARFAAAYRTPDGTERKFEDVGDMVAFGSRMHQLDGASVWVHDFDTEQWIDATTASFVAGGTGIDTPGRGGVVAFADPDRAGDFANEHGATVLTWDELVSAPPTTSPAPSGPPM